MCIKTCAKEKVKEQGGNGSREGRRRLVSLVSQKSSVYGIKLWEPEVQMLLIVEF